MLENYLFIRVKHDKSVEEHEGKKGFASLLARGFVWGEKRK